MRSQAAKGVGFLLLAAALITAFVEVARRGFHSIPRRPRVAGPRRGPARPAPGKLPEQFFGRVVGVTDGDTLSVLYGSGEVRVRLSGIDCPEKGHAYGTRAKLFTSQAAFGRNVTVQVVDHDRYGRVVGEVILPDGMNLNHELLRAGLAWWYRQYSSDWELAGLEAQARAEHRGLWSDASPIPPWEYRKRRATPRRAPAWPRKC
jgi:endonuclease YncB( thermonuclease family)